ncbi:hypothetical protein MJ575_26645 [Klebsiella pneumoniae]|nr:hypothetical protein MJ575_26645 [Klebsiella pneumoniae]
MRHDIGGVKGRRLIQTNIFTKAACIPGSSLTTLANVGLPVRIRFTLSYGFPAEYRHQYTQHFSG